MRKGSITFFILAAVFFVACSPAVQTDEAESVNFSRFETFAYLPSGDSVSNKVVFQEKIINEVTQEMRARGYNLETQNPDLLVLVKSMYEEEERLRREPIYTDYDYYYPGFYTPTTLGPYYYAGYAGVPRLTGYNIEEVEYIQGTFVVDVINAETNQIIWRGWSDTPVDPMDLDNSIRSYVDNIFEEYPVEAE